MAKRKSLTKKTRFEVFKRDSFTCQYCGNKAPDVILEIDHIKPVASGGDNEIINLVTSCFKCNRGKSDREISDDSIISKQRKQIEELNLKRQQLEMMLQWRDSLSMSKNVEYNKACEYFNSKFSGYELNENGFLSIKKLVKKFGFEVVIDAIDIAVEKYDHYNDESDKFEKCLSKLGGICYLSTQPEHVKKIAYIKGILNNKISRFWDYKDYVDERLNILYAHGADLDLITEEVKAIQSSEDFYQMFEL